MASQQGVAGFADWRLPSAEELAALAPAPRGLDRRWFPSDALATGFPWCCTAGDGERCTGVNLETGEQRPLKGGRVLLVRP